LSKHTKSLESVSRTSREAHILIVDDDEDITELLQRTLKRAGYSVTSYNSPSKALKDFRANMFDLALLDIRMPGMNGFELLKGIKKLDANLKCCFLTAFEIVKEDFAQNDIPAKAIDCFIKKPIHLPEFTQKVNTLLEGT
jgi:DNA-binding NtrC family response regulator